MVIIKKVKYLFIDFNVFNCALGNDEFLGVKVNVFIGLSETGAGFLIRSAIFKLGDSEGSTPTT